MLQIHIFFLLRNAGRDSGVGVLLSKLGMFTSLLQTTVGRCWKPVSARVDLSAGDKAGDNGDQLFLKVFPRNRPGFSILIVHLHVVNTPLYHEPGKTVKRNECTRFEEICDFDFLICKSGWRAKMAYGVT